MPTPVVSLEDVRLVRSGKKILDGITWSVHEHERWVVFGPNGAGKTTVLQVASTYLPPTAGTVHLFGRRRGTFDVRPERERIGYAGMGPAQFVKDRLSGIEIVVTGRYASFLDTRWHEYDDTDFDRALSLLHRMAAGYLAEQAYGTMSAGERQRVMVARSLMAEPELLLLDEATTGLDLGAREQLVEALGSFAADPTSPPVVLVTHHVEEIPPGFTHILLLAGGRVVDQGPLETVLTGPTLSSTFGMPLSLQHANGRWHAVRLSGGAAGR